MVSSGTFWVAISYRLAACFTWIGSKCGIEIYWRSFRHFENYNYSLRKIAGSDVGAVCPVFGRRLAPVGHHNISCINLRGDECSGKEAHNADYDPW